MTRPSSWVDDVTGETLIVHLKSDTASLKGVVVDSEQPSDGLILRGVTVLEPDTQTAIEGTLIVPRDNIDFCQRI